MPDFEISDGDVIPFDPSWDGVESAQLKTFPTVSAYDTINLVTKREGDSLRVTIEVIQFNGDHYSASPNGETYTLAVNPILKE